MNKPQMQQDEVLQKVQAAGLEVPAGEVYVVGIRGYFKDTMGKPGVNDINMYDDAMFIIGPDLFEAYNANTDPSKQYPGIATLKAPQVVDYIPGLHGISGKNPYHAFRQASNVTVIRQGGKEETDSPSKRFWIDLHRGGYTTTSSLGCQTVHPDQWEHFRETGYGALGKLKQPKMKYLLIENI